MKLQAAACLICSYNKWHFLCLWTSKVKTSWDRQHVCKSRTSLARKIWAKMTGEQPSLVKAGVKKCYDSQKSLPRGRQAQPQQSHLSGDFRFAPSRFPQTQIVGIHGDLPNHVSSKGKSPSTPCSWSETTVQPGQKGKAHCREHQTPPASHTVLLNVSFVNVQLPWEKIRSDVCFLFPRILHYFQNCRVLPHPPKCCIFMTNCSHCQRSDSYRSQSIPVLITCFSGQALPLGPPPLYWLFQNKSLYLRIYFSISFLLKERTRVSRSAILWSTSW